MLISNDSGIVLRLTAYSETSQIAWVFTDRRGLVRVIAKGARRGTKQRFASGLDVLELGEVSYVPARDAGQLGTLTEWVQRETFPGLRRELGRLYAGLYAAELVMTLTIEDDPHPGLFEELRGTLGGLAGAEEPVRRLAVFQSRLLTALGYTPNFENCVGCGRARVRGAPAYFSSIAGGLLCRDCEMHHVEKARLPDGLVETTAETGDAQAWLLLQDYHLTHLAGRPFKTGELLMKSLGFRRRA